MTDPNPIAHVSDTAYWVASYRATESERPEALFSDPFARRLAGERGEAIVRALPKGAQMGWPMVVRTAVMDEIIMRTITKDDVDCVLNLAAGLDARPWRLLLPPSLRWVDVDHPAMIDYKLSELSATRPACDYEGVRLDLADAAARRTLFARIGADARRVLVITEGLLVYLTTEGVSELARDLYTQSSFGLWLTDLASPGLLKMLEKSWAPVLRGGNAPFRFGPAESTKFFAPFGWREVEFRSVFDEGLRLNRTFPFARVWKFLGRFAGARRREEFRRFSGIGLLQRT